MRIAARLTNTTNPVVFLSYSRADRAFAERLLADLEQAGHPCWLDTTDIPGGEVWIKAIAEGLERAYAVVTVVTEAANRSEWVRLEFLHAKQLGKPIIPLLTKDCLLPWYMADRQAIPIEPDYDTGLSRLLASLPKPVITPTPTESKQRQVELAYLRRLQLGELVHTELYTPMAGVAKVSAKNQASIPLPSVVMRPEFRHLCRITAHADDPPKHPRSYDDILVAFGEVRRAALLGEPGAGKTTTLWKLARDAADQALADPLAPLPLLVRLGKWIAAKEPIQQFIERELGELGAYLEPLLKTRRAVLLLDGLNEVPSTERAAKAALVKSFLKNHKDLLALVSCRELDYTGALDLGLDTVTIRPLDPLRILDFVTSYLGKTDSVQIPPTPLCKGGQGGFIETESISGRQLGEDLFWRLAGGDAVREVWRVWEKAGASLALFWSAQDIPKSKPNVYDKTSGVQDKIWRKAVHDPRSLMRLAGNPYLLYMLTQVYIGSGELPANRALLFDGFVQVLLLREHMAEAEEEWRTTAEGEGLLTDLENLAFALQLQRKSKNDDTEATTVLSREVATQWMGDQLLYRAAAASLLDVGEREMRFTHQLLQEYFTARVLRSRLECGELEAKSLWPNTWQRTGWEESAVLLAGFYADDCTPVIDWLKQAQPEVAAQCILNSGANTPNETLMQLRQDWLPRLTD
ncbi:MAG: TIR domain-containing protein, partial [Candidatus Methylumidiphilus sp.]